MPTIFTSQTVSDLDVDKPTHATPDDLVNSANQWNVNLTQAKAIENLAANGFAKSLSKDGTVTIMSAGDKVYRFYPASTGGGMVGAPSGVPSASVSILDKIVTKGRLEKPLRIWHDGVASNLT